MRIKIFDFFGENLNYIQVGNGYLEFEIKVKKADDINFFVAVDITNEVIRLVNNASVFIFYEAIFSTSSDPEVEQNKYVGPVSTIMRLITQRDGILSTYFDIINESNRS